MPHSTSPKPQVNSPLLHVIRDEDAPPYDDDPQVKRESVVIVPTVIGETILGTLGPSAFAVFWHLSKRSRNGQCWPSLDDISEGVNLSRKHVIRMIEALEKEGWITREKRHNARGMSTSTLYTITVKARTYGSDMDGTSAGHGQVVNVTRTRRELDVELDIPSGESAPKSKKSLPTNGVAQQIVAAYCLVARIEQPAVYRKAVGQAAMLAKAGVTPEDIPDLYGYVAGWAKGADLGLMLNQVDRWRASKATPPSKPKTEQDWNMGGQGRWVG